MIRILREELEDWEFIEEKDAWKYTGTKYPYIKTWKYKHSKNLYIRQQKDGKYCVIYYRHHGRGDVTEMTFDTCDTLEDALDKANYWLAHKYYV